MHKVLLTLVAFGLSATPAVAQQTATASAGSPEAQPAPVAKPKTITKTVCQRVEVERSTGSRLTSTTKLCKQVVVPAPAGDRETAADLPNGEKPRAR